MLGSQEEATTKSRPLEAASPQLPPPAAFSQRLTRKRKRRWLPSRVESCWPPAPTSFGCTAMQQHSASSFSKRWWLLVLLATTTTSSSIQQTVHLTAASNRTDRALHNTPPATTTSRLQVVSGQRLELQCPLKADLQADWIIVWSSNGEPLERLDPRRRIVHSNATLNIANAQPKLDQQTFECALVHKDHLTEPQKMHRFQIRLLEAPKVAPFECPPEAQVGMRLVLTCSVLEGQHPLSFVWLKDGQVVGLDGSSLTDLRRPFTLASLHQHQRQEKLSQLETSSSSSSDEVSDKSISQTTGAKEPELSLLEDARIRVRQAEDYSILSIDKLELRHEGKYSCSVENEAARVSHSAQLAINAPPILTVEPRDRELVAGQSSTLDCAATGQPRPVISWLRARETSSKQLEYVHVYDSLRYTSLSNGSLLLANVSHREQGFYLCTARNGFGPEVSKLVRVNVHEPASFASKYQTVEVRSGERANLVCAASGELPVRIDWLDTEENPIQRQDKRFIIDEANLQESSASSATGLASNGSVSSRLILARSGRSDSGHYTCQASNKYGSDKMVTNLLVLDVPEKPSALKVTNVTATSVLLRWQLAFMGNAQVTSYLIQYQSEDPLDDLLLMPQVVASGPPGGGMATSRSSLASGVAQNSAITSALDMLNKPDNVNSPEDAIDRSLVEISVEQSATNLVVRDLHPCQVYRIRLAAVNRIGLGEFSDWVRAKTEEAPPSGSAARLVASATGPNSVKVSWLPPDRRTWNGQLTGFNVGYRPLDAALELNKTIDWTPADFHSVLGHPIKGSAPTNEVEDAKDPSKAKLLRQHLRQLLSVQQQELVAHLTNLQRSTTYLVWLQAMNSRGLGPQSHAISVRTLDDVPPSAPALRVQTSGHNSVTVSWTLLGNFVSPANQYSLFYRRLGRAANDQLVSSGSEALQERSITSQMITSVDSRSTVLHQQRQSSDNPAVPQSALYQQFLYTLDQLECGSNYELYMITKNTVGKSEPSQVVSARTLGEPPMAPSAKQAMFLHIGPTEAALNLAAWSTGGCPITHMSIRYKLLANSSSSSSSSPSGSQQPIWSLTSQLPQPLLSALNKLHAISDSPPPPAPEPIFLIKNLLPSTSYELQVVAGNAAGDTEAEYEFITAGVNGLGGGVATTTTTTNHLSRKEAGVLPQLQAEYPSDQFGNVHQSRQLLPLALLLVLCLVCLILGAGLCYSRLTTFKKRPPCSNSGPMPPHSPASSMDKSWRMRNQLLDRWPPSEAQALHYCHSPADSSTQRSQPAANHLSATLNHKNPSSTSFCQSVSMRDFNLVTQQQQQQHQRASQVTVEPQLVSSSTLTTAAKRLHQQVSELAPNNKSATLRANHQALYEMSPTPGGQMCSVYGSTCNRSPANRNIGSATTSLDTCQQQELYSAANNLENNPSTSNQLHLCTAGNCSTGNYGCTAGGVVEPMECQQTGNYAIPSGQQTELSKQIVDYSLSQPDYGQTNIEACIQQLVEQQYQQHQHQQQQQQHYAMIVNQKLETAKCHGGGGGGGGGAGVSEAEGYNSAGLQQQQSATIARQTGASQMGPGSLIDSSSTSSGLGDLNAGASSGTGSSQVSTKGCSSLQQQQPANGFYAASSHFGALPGKLFSAANQPDGF